VVFGNETYRDGVELTKDQFYEKLAATGMIPTTAAPPPAMYEEAYRHLARETREIVSVQLAARLSAVYSSAATAAAQVPEARISVIDSEQVSMGCGWLAIAAAEAALQGGNLEQVVALVEGMKARSRVLAVLDTLEFLYRGGRVGWVQAMIGTLLRIKPIIEIYGGEVRLLERSRTQKRALDRLLEMVGALGPLERACVLHANTPELAESVASRLADIAPGGQRLTVQAGVTIASHAGPGAIGVACIAIN
jgi:DegV family protein with EDD domain